MEFEPRPRRRTVDHDEPWYNEPLHVVGVAVVVFAICFALVLAYQEYQKQQAIRELRLLTRQLNSQTEQMTRSLQQAVRPAYIDRIVKEHIPGRSLEACKAETGGEINERFARCRSGYSVTRTVRETPD